jgi:hypothetical protein
VEQYDVPEMPGWRLVMYELSNNYWRVECIHSDGRSVSRDGVELDLPALQRQVIEDARNLPEKRHTPRS